MDRIADRGKVRAGLPGHAFRVTLVILLLFMSLANPARSDRLKQARCKFQDVLGQTRRISGLPQESNRT